MDLWYWTAEKAIKKEKRDPTDFCRNTNTVFVRNFIFDMRPTWDPSEGQEDHLQSLTVLSFLYYAHTGGYSDSA